MAVYVDFAYYQDTFLGSLVTSADFDVLALRASKTIDRFTFNRADAIITAETPVADVTGIKMATCAVVDELSKQDSADHDKAIQSEGVGGHSVSYVDNPDRNRTQFEKIKLAARLWLESTYLMFPGFYEGEYGGSLDDLDD